MSNFDASSFLDSTTKDALTRRPNVPVGTELIGTIGEPKPRQSVGRQDPSQVYTFLDLPIEFDLTQNPSIRQLVGQDKIIVTYGFSVDVTPSGGLDTSPGKNGRLRQLRDALGMNKPGEAFNVRMLQARQIRAKIGERLNDQDGEKYETVSAVAKA